MKKLLLFAAFAVFALTANAQTSFGAKAGVNFASLNGDDADDTDGRTSFHIGGVVNIEISEIFGLQPELVFSAQGYSFDFGGEDGSGRLNYINIPVMADIRLAEGFSLQGGPQFGINISADEEFDGDTEDIDDVETLDLGVGVGAQYKLDGGLFFQARYVIGFSEILEDFDAKNSVASISVGWFFN
jgi:hypothetical protein